MQKSEARQYGERRYALTDGNFMIGSSGMLSAPSNQTVTGRTVLFVLLLSFIALPLQQAFESRSGSSIVSTGKVSATNFLLNHKDRLDLGSAADWNDANVAPSPLFLRIDYKQNLLVWPVIAGNLTRSPPLGNPS